MVATIIFFVLLAGPFILFLVNAAIRRAGDIGIAGGIKKPREAKVPSLGRFRRPKRTAVRARRVSYCGRGFTHFALAIVGSQDACRYCGRLETVEPGEADGPDDEKDAAVAEVEHLLDKGSH